MTRAEYRAQARARGLASTGLGETGRDVPALYERGLAPVRARRVDPIVRPFDRQRDHRVGRQAQAFPTSTCRPDLGDVWVR